MGKRFRSVAVIALASSLSLAACGSPEDTGPEPTVTRIPNPANAPSLSPEASPVAAPGSPTGSPIAAGTPSAAEEAAGQTVTITSHDIFFDPTEVTIPAGSDVTVSLPNEGAAQHNFSIDDLNIHVDIAPGTTEQVVINAPAGSYQYYCNVPGHKEAGMTGTLTVQ
jgi:uncharacterized cupredoxin-like copper-binding protein